MKQKRMIGMSLVGMLLVALTITLATNYFLMPKYGFVRNQKLFTQFKGKKELEQKLTALQQKQMHLLDSLKIQMTMIRDKAALARQQKFYANLAHEFELERQQKNSEYTAQVWQQINEYSQTYGKEKGYDYILGATGDGGIMFLSESQDLTKEVITYINGKYEGK